MLIKSLSARLFLLTISFVMVGEVLIFAPSVARFRMMYFENRIATGELATVAVATASESEIDPAAASQLLARVGARAVVVRRPDGAVRRLDGPAPAVPAETFDLSRSDMVSSIEHSIETLFHEGNRVLRVLGPSPANRADTVEILLDEAPLRRAMWGFGCRVLKISVAISLVTAALLYFSLQWLLVRPMRRITASMTAFRQDPEDGSRRIPPSGRGDEIGRAEDELGMLQETVRQALMQRARLAALGTAVTKINHDLRSILATARLVTDGLAGSAAPEIRRVAPRLLDAIDRAVALCTRTLDFSREGAPPLAPSWFPIAPLFAEIGSGLGAAENGLAIEIAAPPQLSLRADRDQIYRVLLNLARNAVEAGATTLRLSAMEEDDESVAIEVADDGSGLAPRARENLFRPFFGSARLGGTGLGLAISRELMRAHGGDLGLVSTTGAGTLFRLILPQPARQAGRVPNRALG